MDVDVEDGDAELLAVVALLVELSLMLVLIELDVVMVVKVIRSALHIERVFVPLAMVVGFTLIIAVAP